MDPQVSITVGEKIDEAAGEAIKNLANPITKEAGNTFGNFWFLVCGGISHAADKKRLKLAYKLEEFKNEIETKYRQIPPENLIEPKFQTIGPALERAKFCVEEPELREMFANLITSAMNSDTASKVQPCFAGIIEQMTPLDAQNLMLFRIETELPLACYREDVKPEGTNVFQRHVFLSNPSVQDIERQALSISNLEYLGLVFIDHQRWIVEEGAYEAFSQTEMYQQLENSQAEKGLTASIQVGIVAITPLGQSFLEVCMYDELE